MLGYALQFYRRQHVPIPNEQVIDYGSAPVEQHRHIESLALIVSAAGTGCFVIVGTATVADVIGVSPALLVLVAALWILCALIGAVCALVCIVKTKWVRWRVLLSLGISWLPALLIYFMYKFTPPF